MNIKHLVDPTIWEKITDDVFQAGDIYGNTESGQPAMGVIGRSIGSAENCYRLIPSFFCWEENPDQSEKVGPGWQYWDNGWTDIQKNKYWNITVESSGKRWKKPVSIAKTLTVRPRKTLKKDLSLYWQR